MKQLPIASNGIIALIMWFLLVPVTCTSLSGCAGCTRTSVPANVSIQISDPTFLRLAEVTSQIDLKASGTLRPGRYSFRHVPLVVPADTSFTLTLSLPVKDATTLDVRSAAGKLTTSRTISISSIPVPQDLEISGGKATADVDFGRTLAAFLIDLFQKKESKLNTNMQDVVRTLQVDKADFRLRPDSSIDLKTIKANISEGSTITLSDLKCDERFNYRGDCSMRINLKSLAVQSKDVAPQTSNDAVGNHVQLTAAATKLAMNFDIARNNDALTLKWKAPGDKAKSVISLADFQCAAGNGTIFGAHCDLQIGSCSLTKRIDEEPVDIKLDGLLRLSEAALISKSPQRRIRAALPGRTAVKVSINRDQKSSSWQILSPNEMSARNLEWQIHRKNGTVQIELASANTSAISLSSGKGLSVSLKQGKLVPTKLTWQSNGRTISARLRDSAIVLPNDVHFDVNSIGSVQAEEIKLWLQAPLVELRKDKQTLQLHNLQGDVVLTAANDQIELKSRLSMRVNSSPPISLDEIPLTIESVQLTATKNGIDATLQNCKITMPTTTLAQAVRSNLPAQRSIAVSKPVLQNRRWRYRNMNLTNVTLTRPILSKLEFEEDNIVDIDGAAEISAKGTVERFQLGLSPSDSGGPRGWIEHPWSAQGHVDGSGRVNYHIITGSSLADTKLAYDLNLKMKVPENLSVDWSQVAGDIPAKAELALLGAVLKHAALFDAADGIPVKSSGTVPLFKNADPRLKKLKVAKFKTTVKKDTLTILFSAQSNL
ncbi:MAG: hypothetical protein K2W95_03270 [Candidatus Obscuribacterales bacterium]|nr:hypothetical protein [Candidatus Obscuribacterales bacterium]